MKLAAFNYTDAKNKTTQRVILVTEQPQNKLQGIDVTELDDSEAVSFARQYGRLLDDFRQQVLELQAEFDVTHNFRQFLPERMEAVEYVQVG